MVNEINQPKPDKRLSQYLVPLFITTLLLIITYIVSNQMIEREKRLISNTIQAKSDELSNIMFYDLERRIHLLQRMSQYWDDHHYNDQAHFDLIAANHIEDLPGFQALGWVDKNYYVRWIIPREGNEKAINLYLGFEPKRLTALNKSKNDIEPVFTSPIDLVQGGRGFIGYFPIMVHSEFKGFISAVFQSQRWFKYIYPDNIISPHDFKVEVSMDDKELYTLPASTELANTSWQKKSPAIVGYHNAKITITPTKHYIEKKQSLLITFLNLIGVIISLLAGTLVYYMLQARRQLQTSLQLSNEINALNNELEQRILEQTEELSKSNQELERLAQNDSLTNIANRSSFDISLEKTFKRCNRNNVPLSLLMIDIDFFKEVNDLYGHMKGDEYLIQIAHTLTDTLNRTDYLPARFGGEEFAVILPETDLEGARIIAETIRRKIIDLKLENSNSKIAKYLTVSIGIATASKEIGITPKELIQRADLALYKAKHNGRNRVYAFQI